MNKDHTPGTADKFAESHEMHDLSRRMDHEGEPDHMSWAHEHILVPSDPGECSESAKESAPSFDSSAVDSKSYDEDFAITKAERPETGYTVAETEHTETAETNVENQYPKPLALSILMLGICLAVFLLALDRTIVTTVSSCLSACASENKEKV